VRVIGVGQACRGDDEVGLLVAARLRALPPEGFDITTESGDAAALLGQFEALSAAIIIDSARSAAPAGTLLTLDAEVPLPRHAASSSHGNALAGALALGRALGLLPPRLKLLLVAGEAYALGAAMTPAVRDAVPAVAARARAAALAMLAEAMACTKPI
jgi:hydrogenase maturation protease